jgi:hypothetical protein
MEKSGNVTNTGIIMKKSYDLFMACIALILNLIDTNITDETRQVKKNTNKFLEALLDKKFEAEDMGNIIKKVFTVIANNLIYLKDKNSKLFQLREVKNEKQLKVTILPGIDLDEAHTLLQPAAIQLLWKYIRGLYIASSQLILLVNKSGVDDQTIKLTGEITANFNRTELFTAFHTIYPESTLIQKEVFDPFIGVGNNDNFSIDDILTAPQLPSEGGGIGGIGDMTSMLGIDKMFDLGDLSNQLKNLNQQDINDATENIKKLLGNNVDVATSDMITMMLQDITQELKSDDLSNGGNPINNIIKIAQSVAEKMMPKIDTKKIDITKMWNSTQNLAKNYVDKKGNKIFQNNNNPLSMLNNLVESHIKNSSQTTPSQSSKPTKDETMKEYEDIFKKMGLTNADMTKIKNMDPNVLLKGFEANNKSTKTNKKQ